MRILILFDGYRTFSDRTRIRFIRKLSKFCNINIYGPSEHQLDPMIAPLDFDSRIQSRDIKNYFNPDVLLFVIYRPRMYDWLNDDICKIGIPSVLIYEDQYFPEEIEEICKNKNLEISLFITRQYHPKHKRLSAPNVWLPFSVDEEEFYPESCNRENKIGFAGSLSDHEIYTIRKIAFDILKNGRFLSNRHGKFDGEAYGNYLRSVKGALTCHGATIHTPLAKSFEIPLCGAAMVANETYGKELLWGTKQCFFEYKDDCSNLIGLANDILYNDTLVREVSKNALEQVREKHTDSKRIVELYNILLALVGGWEIPKVWGV